MLTETQMRRENEVIADQRAQEESRKNRGFVQVYEAGWRRLQALMKHNPNAARLYALLAEHIDSGGVVVASQAVLAEMLEVSEKTVQRRTAELEDARALVRIRVGGGVYAYALNPEEIWKAWDAGKDFATFHSKTLVSKKDPESATITRKLMVMVHELRNERGQLGEQPLEAGATG